MRTCSAAYPINLQPEITPKMDTLSFLVGNPSAVSLVIVALSASAGCLYFCFRPKLHADQHTRIAPPNASTDALLNDALEGVSKPVSVNYHFTRKCNKVCGFCFHTEKTSHVASEEDMKRGLKLLKEAGMEKINFAGGEPFLYPKQLAMLCEYCKIDLQLESVSIISNGTKITRAWLQKHGQFVDVLGVSCDSFDEATNIEIGRGTELQLAREDGRHGRAA